MIDVVEPPPAACLTDPYELEAWLEQLPEGERDMVERGVAASLGHRSLVQWKEHHAFGIGLGRPLDELPRGTYAFFYCGPEPLREILPETLGPPDLAIMAEAAGLDAEELEELDDEERARAIEEALREGIMGEHGDGFFKHAEAPSIFALLRIMVAHGDLGIDPDPTGTDELWRDEKLDEVHAYLRPIRDPYLRRIAAELSGEGWQMERIDDYDQAVYCQGILARRPGWSLVFAWDAQPPAQDFGACVLYRPADDEVGTMSLRRPD
jgi:hypothetical protein